MTTELEKDFLNVSHDKTSLGELDKYDVFVFEPYHDPELQLFVKLEGEGGEDEINQQYECLHFAAYPEQGDLADESGDIVCKIELYGSEKVTPVKCIKDVRVDV